VIALPRRRRKWLQTAVAAVLALSIAGGPYTYAAVDACAYVSIDVEESSIGAVREPPGPGHRVRSEGGDTAALARELGRDVRHMKVTTPWTSPWPA
jgi:hypothetical protein